MKKIIVIAPVLPQSTDIKVFINTLSFLNETYEVDFIDPLSLPNQDLPTATYYQFWREQFKHYSFNYDAFIGFSFGGVIIQQCFPLFQAVNKPIILVSTPTFADKSLTSKLSNVIALAQANKIEDALDALYRDVYYPNSAPAYPLMPANKDLIAQRLMIGLGHVLATDSSTIINSSKVKYVHLIGEHSHLVNVNNVIVANNGRLISVPEAGMRVLEDNLAFCKSIILENLSCEE